MIVLTSIKTLLEIADVLRNTTAALICFLFQCHVVMCCAETKAFFLCMTFGMYSLLVLLQNQTLWYKSEQKQRKNSHGVGSSAAVALLADDRCAKVLGVGERKSVERLQRRQRNQTQRNKGRNSQLRFTDSYRQFLTTAVIGVGVFWKWITAELLNANVGPFMRRVFNLRCDTVNNWKQLLSWLSFISLEKLQDGAVLTSLSAKWRAPFRQRDERLRVFSSPSSNTAETRDEKRLKHRREMDPLHLIRLQTSTDSRIQQLMRSNDPKHRNKRTSLSFYRSQNKHRYVNPLIPLFIATTTRRKHLM